MKNLAKAALFLVAGALLTTACKKDEFLEPKTSALTEDTVFTDSTRTMAFLASIYADEGYSFNKGRWGNGGNTEQATDDAEWKLGSLVAEPVILYSGSLSPLNIPGNFWTLPWVNIRRVNLLLSKLPSTPLSPRLRARVVAESRFLRAWYYYNLLASFGGVPLIGDKLYGLEDNISQPRNSYAECVDYLVQELDAAAAGLPDANGYSAPDYGRITKGACLALKARLLLYAASPLFNGGAETGDAGLAALVSYPSASAARWQAAADAAQALITGPNALYALNVDNTTAPGYGFYNVFLRRVNSEYIFFVNRPANRDMEAQFFPSSRGGSNFTYPTQNLVDAFPMRNGKPITDPTSGYNPQDPYANRDPRFNNTIVFNHTAQTPSLLYLASANAPAAVNTYEGAPTDGFDRSTNLTGYYGRKMCNATDAANTERGWPLIRYAEILLNYAEAINETGQPALAVPSLLLLRQRAGITAGADGRYGIPAGVSQASLRDIIRTERRVELAYEDHRWNDIRRWKIAMVTNNRFNDRVRVVRGGAGTAPSPYTYSYSLVSSLRQHIFRPEMYLMPLPDAEVRKVAQMRQNPGW